MAERLTPLDLEVRCLRIVHHVVSLDIELYPTLSPFTQVYKWVPATYCCREKCDHYSIKTRHNDLFVFPIAIFFKENLKKNWPEKRA